MQRPMNEFQNTSQRPTSRDVERTSETQMKPRLDAVALTLKIFNHVMEDIMKIALNFSVGIVLVVQAFAFDAAAKEPVLTAYDQIKIDVQQVCPVSGNKLRSMGDPIKVKVGQEEIYLCCKGCSKGKIDKALWEQIHRNFAAAQGICPVMEKPLPANPKSTTVNGQTVYICCPPCTKKIQAEPRKYLTKLAGYYLASLKTPASLQVPVKANDSSKIAQSLAKLPESDRLRASIQQVCPVSGNMLGLAGTPKKVRVGKLDVFLCCEGCQSGEINKEHWTKIAQNIRNAQGKCPVMEKDLPATAKSMIVAGQLVFVCCPPCTKKIAASPAQYMSKVESYYRESRSETTSVAARRSKASR